MALWGSLIIYVVISGFILIFSKKYGFRIAIALGLGLLMLFIFEDTPKDTFFCGFRYWLVAFCVFDFVTGSCVFVG